MSCAEPTVSMSLWAFIFASRALLKLSTQVRDTVLLVIIAPLWKCGGYTGFALSFHHSVMLCHDQESNLGSGERGGSVVECRTPEREVGGSKPTAAVLCPWARNFIPRKYWLITQEAVAPSLRDWKIVDWDVKPQHKQNLGSGSKDSSPEVMNHYPEMTECGRNLNCGTSLRPMDKTVIIFCRFYKNLFTDDIIIDFNEMKKKKKEMKWKRKKKKNTKKKHKTKKNKKKQQQKKKKNTQKQHIFDSGRPYWSSFVIQFSQFIHSLYQFRFDHALSQLLDMHTCRTNFWVTIRHSECYNRSSVSSHISTLVVPVLINQFVVPTIISTSYRHNYHTQTYDPSKTSWKVSVKFPPFNICSFASYQYSGLRHKLIWSETEYHLLSIRITDNNQKLPIWNQTCLVPQAPIDVYISTSNDIINNYYNLKSSYGVINNHTTFHTYHRT